VDYFSININTSDQELTPENFRKLLKEKISKTNIELVKADVRPFIKNPGELDIWTTEYFIQLVNMIRFKS